MSSTYVEGRLEFTFGDRWRIVRYDDRGGWYRRVMEPALDGTAAVDFLGVFGTRQLFFIEVSDARGQAISSRHAQRRESLDHETGRKVRDTVAGSVGALRTGQDDPFWRTVRDVLTDRNGAVWVVLWYEPDVSGRPDIRRKRVKGALNTLSKNLQRRLRWLAHRRFVSVRSMQDTGLVLPEVTVRSAAGTV